MDKNKQYFEYLQTQLYSAVISDILDDLGYRKQTMHESVRPVAPGMMIVGRSYPVLVTDIFEVPEHPFEGLIKALDHIKPGDVYMASVRSNRSAFWGELVSNASLAKGGRGAIIDGCVRDTEKIIELGFPVFGKGFTPRDCKGRNIVIQYNVPIECAGVQVQPGDLVFADHDGVVVVPQEVEEETIQKALEKSAGEDDARKWFREGKSVQQVFEKFGIL